MTEVADKPAATATQELPLLVTEAVPLPGQVIRIPAKADMALLRAMQGSGNKIFIASSKDAGEIGVVAQVVQRVGSGDDLQFEVITEERGRLNGVTKDVDGSGASMAEVETVDLSAHVDQELVSKALARFAVVFGEQVQQRQFTELQHLATTKPHKLADTLMVLTRAPADDMKKCLQEMDPNEQLNRVLIRFQKAEELQKAQKELQELQEKRQRHFVLTELSQMMDKDAKEIAKELGEGLDEDELDLIEEKIKEAGMPAETQAICETKLSNLRRKRQGDQEGEKLREYLDEMLALPWKQSSDLVTDLGLAEEVLDADHYGLEKVKARIVEQLAVQMQTAKTNGTILCLAGPPGVGKTSIGKSIAKATGRKFVRVSLGGVSDEADIRGHRTTYVGAKPGRIMDAMKEAGTNNPVVQLDEIDKMSSGNGVHGDPTAAMLEVLDPAQNHAFKDKYMDVAFDLSNAMFVATANYLEKVPAPLLDRMEVIQLSGYTAEEKLEIAKRYLVPKALETSGLTAEQFSITNDALQALIEGYTLEAGVRGLEKEVNGLTRKAVVSLQKGESSVSVTTDNLEDFAGPKKIERKQTNPAPQVGHVNGLAVMGGMSGDVLPIEAAKFATPGKGTVEATGNLKETIAESVRYADAFVKAHATEFGFTPDEYMNNTVHIRVGNMGGTPSDGPSAGLAIATLITSVRTGIAIRGDVAMTGQIGMLGQSGIIGGVDHKLDGAFKAGIKTAIIPVDNLKDLANPEFPKKLKESLIMAEPTADPNAEVPEGKMRVIAVNNIMEVLRFALETQPQALTQEQILAAQQAAAGEDKVAASLSEAAQAFNRVADQMEQKPASQAFAQAAAPQQAPANNNTPAPKQKKVLGIFKRRQPAQSA